MMVADTWDTGENIQDHTPLEEKGGRVDDVRKKIEQYNIPDVSGYREL